MIFYVNGYYYYTLYPELNLKEKDNQGMYSKFDQYDMAIIIDIMLFYCDVISISYCDLIELFKKIVDENKISPKFILVNKGQKINDIINEGNMFLSIGFTTPFFDCLAALKPSAYVFPYNLENVRIPIKRELILKTKEEICEFLLSNKILSNNEINTYNRKQYNDRLLEISNVLKEI